MKKPIVGILVVIILFALLGFASPCDGKRFAISKNGVDYMLFEKQIYNDEYVAYNRLTPELIKKKRVGSQDEYYLKYYYVKGVNTGCGSSGSKAGDITVVDEIRGIPVASIDCELGKRGKKIILPDSIRFIKKRIFGNVNVPNNLINTTAYCVSNVDNIEMERGIYYWGDWQVGFSESMAGNNITVRDGTIGILDLAVKDSKNVKSITIPDSVKYIGDKCFDVSKGMTQSLNFKNVEYVGDEAFSGARFCELRFSDKLKYVGRSAFYGSSSQVIDVSEAEGCYFGNTAFASTSISSFVLPNKIKVIPNEMFKESKVSSVKIPDSVISIGNYTFAYCKNLRSIELPKNLEKIWAHGFSGAGVEIITVPGTVENIMESSFYCCTSLTRLVISEGTKRIEKDAFSSCSSLTSVSLPKSLNAIESEAFKWGGAAVITVPENVRYIGSGAFSEKSTVYFADAKDWRAGNKSISESELRSNSNVIYNSFRNYDWVKGSN